MEPVKVQQTINLVDTAFERVVELRSRRIGRRSTQDLHEDVQIINRNIATAHDKGIFLGQKALWFNHDHQLNELGNLKTIVEKSQHLLEDMGVKQEIVEAGYSLKKTSDSLWKSHEIIRDLRSHIATHESLLSRGLSGQPTPSTHLEQLERHFVSAELWKDSMIEHGKTAINRIRNKKEASDRAAAALVLAIANAVNSA